MAEIIQIKHCLQFEIVRLCFMRLEHIAQISRKNKQAYRARMQ